jgi:geranylgeranyl pyrophosphate synthase
MTMTINQVDDVMKAVDEQLHNIVSTDIDLLEEASHHIIESGGKRLRPRLVFLAYLAAGGQDLSYVVPLASAVELVHTATLVHDDINDHSLTRRGKISVHARWGRTFALLTGDYLFAKVYELMAPYGSTLNVMMANACVRLVEGETLQAAAAKAGSIDQQTYHSIISRKTASLFEAAARMGAISGGANEQLVDALGEYSRYLGLAFQVIDDILDFIGDPAELGKPVGSDLHQGSGAIMAQNGKKVHDVPKPRTADPIEDMMARLQESGAVEAAQIQAQIWADKARGALLRIPASPIRSELQSLVDLVIRRDR